jgi:dUTP pyrophosphatase
MKLKLLTPTSKLPVRATLGASCWDVFANEKFALLPGERCVVKLGFAVELWPGTEIQIRPRSGLSAKHGIVSQGARIGDDGILWHLGTIDSDYRDRKSVV